MTSDQSNQVKRSNKLENLSKIPQTSISRREFIKLFGASAAASMLAACAQTGTPVPDSIVTPATFTPVPTISKPVTVRYWTHLAPPDPLMHQLVEDFNKEFEGKIRVEMEVIPWDGIYQKLTTAITAGDPPDCAGLHDNWIGAFAKAGWSLPLNEYFDSWEYKNTIPQSFLDTGSAGPGQGFIRLPVSYVSTFLYYRRDWLEEVGLEPPKTHEEFLEACKAITRPEENRYAYGMRGSRNGQFHWEPFILQSGGNYADSNGNIVIDSDEAKKANQFYCDLYLKHKVCRPSGITDNWPEISEGLSKGDLGMFIHTINIHSLLNDALGDKIAATLLPEDKRSASTMVAVGSQILKGSKHPDEAWEWISYLTRPDIQKRILYNPDIQVLPISSTLSDDPKFQEPLYQISLESAKTAVPLPLWLNTYGEMVEKEWSPVFQSVLLGEMEPDKMMDDLAQFLKGEA